MKIGPIEVYWHKGKKSYSDLVTILNREKGNPSFDPRTNVNSQLSEYKSWTATCVSLIKDRVGQIPYKFYLKDSDSEVTSNKHGYKDFTKPFFNPNPLMSFQFIKQFCQIQLDLCGMAIIYKAKNALGQVWELWPLNMNNFMGTYDPSGKPIEMSTQILPSDVFYSFDFNGSNYMFSSTELVVLYYPHPKNPFLSASPIQQQAYGVDIQQYVEIYERDFFANSARIDMVLSTELPIDEKKAVELKERWLEKYGFARTGRFNDIAVLDSGLKPIPMKWTNKDFEFMELAKWTKEMIFGAYRIPASKVGSSNSENRQNSVYVDINFNTDCIAPRLSMWDIELTKEVLISFDPKIEIRHDNPIPRDRQIEVQEGRIYMAGFPSMTPDEFRKRVHNLPPIEGGDKLYVPSSFIPLDKLDKYVDSNIKRNTAPKPAKDPNDTDPSRHDGDTPNTNPDGSDDRDTLPTSGRMLINLLTETFAFEFYLRNAWNVGIMKYFENLEFTEANLVDLFKFLCKSSVNLYIKYRKEGFTIENNKWIDDYCVKISSEVFKMVNPSDFKSITDIFNTNPRISKICNTAVRSCINNAKFLILVEHGTEKKWVCNSNECGHRGRIKDFAVGNNEKFKIGNSEVDWPGQVFNLACDCTLDI